MPLKNKNYRTLNIYITMKKIIFSILLCSVFYMNAQQKSLLESQDFWKSKPTLQQVKAEVDKGVDFKNVGFDDPILKAILEKADSDIINYLINLPSVDLEKKLFHDRTYLHFATNEGLTNVVANLIKKGSNINALDDKGFTPLVFASLGGKLTPEIVDIFAKNGIDLTQKYKSFGNANLLLLAIGHDKGLKITDYLIKKGLTLNSKDDEGRGVFYYASLVGNNLDNLKELVKRGVKYDDSALLAVAQGAHKVTNGLAAYQYLIDTLKLNPKITSPEGETLLHFVAKKANQDDVITYLIAKGVDAKKADKFGNTPFLLACSGKSVNAVKYLLPFVENINEANRDGETAIINAMKYSNADVVEYLINNGASLNTTNKKGNNLVYLLIEAYHPRKNGKEFDGKLKLLQKKGIDFSKKLADGSTIYHLIATKNDLELFKKVENINVDINAKNNDGLTALHKAILVAKDDTILKYLISRGADKTIKTDLGETAYDLAKDNEMLRKNNINIDFLK